MIEPYRGDFNARFTEAKYAALLRLMEERTQTKIEFRIAETPCFFCAGVDAADGGCGDRNDRAVVGECEV